MLFMVGCFFVKSGVFLKSPRTLFQNIPGCFEKVSGCFLHFIAMFFQKDGEVFDLVRHFLAPNGRFSLTKKGRFWPFSPIFQHPNLTFKDKPFNIIAELRNYGIAELRNYGGCTNFQATKRSLLKASLVLCL